MVFSQSEMLKAGDMVGPRVYSTGTILYGADGDFKAVINSLDDARSNLRRLKAVGAFSVKSYNQPRRDQRQQIIEAARELQMEVVPEGGSTFFTNMNMILDGHTGIEHCIPVWPVYKDVKSLWNDSKSGLYPYPYCELWHPIWRKLLVRPYRGVEKRAAAYLYAANNYRCTLEAAHYVGIW